MLFTLVILTLSHFSLSTNFTCILCICSLFLAQPKVLHCTCSMGKPMFSFGRHIGRTKSLKVIGWSSFIRAIVLPSTGDFTIPIILLSCSQGVELKTDFFNDLNIYKFFMINCFKYQENMFYLNSLVIPNLAIHSALGWPWKQDVVVATHSADIKVPSQIWTSSLKRALCQGQSP